jgi:UDP-hydrolysing UDP-N-acetyl-D-glucosamine 2-epimerase
MRTIAVITVARSDYGLYRPVLDAITAHSALRLRLVAGGMHLSEEHGLTVREIEADGYIVAARIEAVPASDDPVAIAASIGASVVGFAEAFKRLRPDLVLVLGDRYEMLAAVVAALPLTLPVAHVHGGESTEGLIDEGIRHATTKLSHLHFAATEAYARRIVQMGEEPWRVHVVGAPGLDAIAGLEPLSLEELESLTGIALGEQTLLATYHPVTLEHEQVEDRVGGFLAALDRCGFDVLFTAPNADTRNRTVTRMIEAFVAEHPGSALVTSLGSRAYLSALIHVRALVGNSSSGIIEAASFRLPVVDVGRRQQGRLRAANVVHVEDEPAAIEAAIARATSSEFRAGLAGLVNPYGDGHAAERIVAELAGVPLDDRLLVKRFHDLSAVKT